MKNEEFVNFIKKNNIPVQKWITLSNLDAIILNNGIGVYPNPLNEKFYIKKDKIYVQYGTSVLFGDEIIGNYQVGVGKRTLTFNMGEFDVKTHNFRYPKQGDIIQTTNGVGKILVSAYIFEIQYSQNVISIDLSNPLFFEPGVKLSFYDPTIRNEGSYISNVIEGLSFNFSINTPYLKEKFGNYHKIINVKNIKEILLKNRGEYDYRTIN